MGLLPEVERALMEGINRHNRRRKVRPAWVGYRVALTAVVAVVVSASLALATGALSLHFGPGLVGAARQGERPLAPTGPLWTLDGREWASLAQYRGEVVVVSFWEEWCEPCWRQLPALWRVNEEMHRQHAGAVVLVEERASEPPHPAAMRRHYGNALPVLLADAPFLKAYEVESWPATFIVDPAGRVSGVVEGLSDPGELRKLVGRAARER
jgi:thiol-disulfide isomerase/thioredoxin